MVHENKKSKSQVIPCVYRLDYKGSPVYVGETTLKLKYRHSGHKRRPNPRMQEFIDAHGITVDDLVPSVIEYVEDAKERIDREYYWIQELKPPCNDLNHGKIYKSNRIGDPVIYIVEFNGYAYVGRTNSVLSRMSDHAKYAHIYNREFQRRCREHNVDFYECTKVIFQANSRFQLSLMEKVAYDYCRHWYKMLNDIDPGIPLSVNPADYYLCYDTLVEDLEKQIEKLYIPVREYAAKHTRILD